MTATKTISALEITRTFDAAPARVFDAWLSKSWGEWAGPGPVRGEVVLMEPHVGGAFRVVMHMPDGETLTVGGTYHEILRPTKLVFSWKWEHEAAATLVTLTFLALGNRTEMKITHEGFLVKERRESHRDGWSGTFDKLAIHLAKN